MSELAFNLNGEPFDLPLTATGWRVRKFKSKGAPEVVYGREGTPLVLPIDADMADLRREARSEGHYRLDAIDECNRPIAGAPPAYHCYRLCRAAALPERGWHILRHAFGTHAAMFGVNPWKLMLWMGHKADRRDDALRPVRGGPHAAVPETILAAGRGNDDPDRRVIAMLSARRNGQMNGARCSQVAAEEGSQRETSVISLI
jgi:integrase